MHPFIFSSRTAGAFTVTMVIIFASGTEASKLNIQTNFAVVVLLHGNRIRLTGREGVVAVHGRPQIKWLGCYQNLKDLQC